MDIPVTQTKVMIPQRREDLLSRERLVELAYDYIDYKLVVISAPAGYGKTSLLIDLAYQIELPVCWFTLDELDRDIKRFVAHFLASINRQYPAFGKVSEVLLQGSIQRDADIDRLVATIVNEAYECIPEHFMLVLDDYHFVADNDLIARFVNRFLQQVDENCHLVISSRQLLSLPDLSLLVARSQAVGLGFEELAFSAQEIQDLLLRNYQMTISKDAAEELVSETEGWVTGLLLSAETMWQGMVDRLRKARSTGVALYDYLAEQVFDRQPPDIQDFLLNTSLLEEYNAELCETILGPATQGRSWHELIRTVLKSNLFVLPVENGGTWLRYHHLFRDFLQARLRREHPEAANRILHRMIEVFSEQSVWERAYDVCRRLGDDSQTANLIELAGRSLIKNGRFQMLAGWIEVLPLTVVAERPWIRALQGGAVLMIGEVERGLSLLNQAVAAFQKEGASSRLAITILWRSVAHRFLGNYQDAIADADRVLAMDFQDDESDATQAKALRAKGLSLNRIGQVNEAIALLKQSMQAFTLLGEEHDRTVLRMELGWVYMNSGRFDQAMVQLNQALEHWEKTNDLTRLANLLNNLGVLYHLTGDYRQAGRTLERALDCARRSGYSRIEALALSSIGDLYADLDGLDAALDTYQQSREIARRLEDRFLLLYLDLAEVTLARKRADHLQARRSLASAEQFIQNSGSHYEQGLYWLEAGRLALSEKDIKTAIVHLSESTQHFGQAGQKVERARASLYLALAHHSAGNQAEALIELERTFNLAVDLESEHILVTAGRDAKNLLKDAEKAPLFGPQVIKLIRRIDQFERNIPGLRRDIRQQAAVVPFAPPKLTLKALGSAQVFVDGKLVSGADWEAQVARDLLFCLLAFPEGLTKEVVGEMLWPGVSPDKLRLRFKKTIYRLRHAMNQNVVLFEHDTYLFNWELDYEYDVESFEKMLSVAGTAIDPGERVSAYRDAVDLYGGPYLPGVEGSWVSLERERLFLTFMDALLKLCEHHLEAGDYESTLEYCQLAQSYDQCQEDFYRLAMRASAALGNHAEVVRQYENCRRALSTELGISPSPQTEALYQSLIR
jgi:LuxR family maltose regulon positive regulatory protein